MKCEQVRDEMIDLLEGSASKENMHKILKHIDECDTCRQDFEEIKNMSATLSKGFSLDDDNIRIPLDFDRKLQNRLSKEKVIDLKRSKFIFRKIALIAIALMLIFAITINTSTSVAYYLHKIPVIQDMVKFGLLDKGLVSAVEGDVGQKVNKSQTYNGITFTVHEVISSDNRTVLLCTIDWNRDIDGVPYPSVAWATKGYKHGTLSHCQWNYDKDNNRSSGIIEFRNMERQISKLEVTIPQIHLPNDQIIQGPWKLSFYVDKDKAKEKHIKKKINETIKGINGSIKINEVVTSASETAVNFVKEKTAKDIGNIILIDQNGQEYTQSGLHISMNKGQAMFSLTYPNKVSKIIVKDIKEEISINKVIPISLNESYPKEVDLLGRKWAIAGVEKLGNIVKVKFPIRASPVDNIIKASLECKNGKTIKWTEKRQNSHLEGIEKVAGENCAHIYQVISFSGVEEEQTTFDLKIEDAVIYTRVVKEIVLN